MNPHPCTCIGAAIYIFPVWVVYASYGIFSDPAFQYEPTALSGLTSEGLRTPIAGPIYARISGRWRAVRNSSLLEMEVLSRLALQRMLIALADVYGRRWNKAR
ncbi:hypothetical protein MRX96_054519 [Rhipicephalus microplus]